MQPDRLTPEDELMLWPDAAWPQDIGALAILEGGDLVDAEGRFRIEVVREALAARLHRAPRFRQVLQVPPRRLGAPVWVDAREFDIANHVRVMQVPAPGGEAELLRAVEEQRRRRLDRSRPLWDMCFLPGLKEGHVGLYMRTHHVVADGMAGVAAMAAFLDTEPDAPVEPAPAWAPTAGPSDDELLADLRRRRANDRTRAVAGLLHPVTALRRLGAAWPAMREIVAEEDLPATSLKRLVGPDRTLALVRSRFSDIRDIAHAHGAKVNDVLLAVIAGGLRELLSSRGESVAGLTMRIYVPVTQRHGDRPDTRANLIGQMVVPLPVGVADPASRLRQIAAETATRKARVRPSLGKMPQRGLLGRWFLKLIDRQHVNVTSTDLPGPVFPLYVAGARLIELFPLLPLIGSVSLGVGAMSYTGQFNIGIVADADTCPDIDAFATGVREDLERLAALTSSKLRVA